MAQQPVNGYCMQVCDGQDRLITVCAHTQWQCLQKLAREANQDRDADLGKVSPNEVIGYYEGLGFSVWQGAHL